MRNRLAWLLLLHSLSYADSVYFFALQRVNVCLCLYMTLTTPKSRFSWRMKERRVEFCHTFVCLCFRVVKAVDLEFKLLNNNNTCSHLAFIVLLFSFRFIVFDLLLLLFHQQITACSLRINVPSIYFDFLFLFFYIHMIFFIDLELMGCHTDKANENIKFYRF